MKKSILFLILLLKGSNILSQVYSVSDENISVSIKVATSRDSVIRYDFTVVNMTDFNMYLCKLKSRIYPFYVNVIDGPIIFGCGCEYGFNQDFGKMTNELEVLKIKSKDTLRFQIKQVEILGKSLSKKQFARRNKIIKVEYIISNNFLLFGRSEDILREFENKRRKIVATISAGG